MHSIVSWEDVYRSLYLLWCSHAPDLHLCYKETWKSQGNASYRKLLIALHLKSNLKSQFFNQFCFIFMWLGRNTRRFPINSLHLCPWSDMLTNEHGISSNSSKNLWFLKRIYLIYYTVITVESKTMSVEYTSQNFQKPMFCNRMNGILSPRPDALSISNTSSTVLSSPAEQEAGTGTAVAIMRWKDIAPDKITIRLKFVLY